MLKREELSNPNSCMSRALPDERTFVLLARDAAAPDTIVGWATERVERGLSKETDSQIVEALECASLMERERAGIRAQLSAGASRPVEAQTPRLTIAENLLDRAATFMEDQAVRDDPNWWREYFLFTGQHMILTDEGWESGDSKQPYLDDLAKGIYDESPIIDEINAPDSPVPAPPAAAPATSERIAEVQTTSPNSPVIPDSSADEPPPDLPFFHPDTPLCSDLKCYRSGPHYPREYGCRWGKDPVPPPVVADTREGVLWPEDIAQLDTREREWGVVHQNRDIVEAIFQDRQQAESFLSGTNGLKLCWRTKGRRFDWRVGSKVPVNIYEDDRIVGQCQTAGYARRIVDGMNTEPKEGPWVNAGPSDKEKA